MTLGGSAAADGRSMTARLFAVLGAFKGAPPGRSLTLTEIARHAGLPISTSHRLVSELVRCEALARRADGSYYVGFRLWEIGEQTPAAQLLRTAAMPYLEEIHSIAKDDVMLAVLDADEIVCVANVSRHPSSCPMRPTDRAPASTTAIGRLLLAHAGELGKWCAAPNRVSDSIDLVREAEMRFEGVARLEAGGLLSVAAPIRNGKREIVAGIAVTFAAVRPRERAYDDALRMAARGISGSLGHKAHAERAKSEGAVRRSPGAAIA